MSIIRISRAAEPQKRNNQLSDHLAAWKTVLSQLESQLVDGESFLASLQAAKASAEENPTDEPPATQIVLPPSLDFTPPAGLGPIPSELVEQARAILQRQRDLEAATQAAMGTARKHSDAAKAMRPSAPSVPVYFDGAL